MVVCAQIVPPVFPPWVGGIQNSVKGKWMAGSDSTRATVYNKPGVGVRKMEAIRWVAALFFLILLFVGIFLGVYLLGYLLDRAARNAA